MLRFALLALVALAGFAQTAAPPPNKPPAEVDQALRARVNEFYTLLVNHEYRKAESYVADDTKDFYYAGSKPDVVKFEIASLTYSDQFTNALVTVKCTQKVPMPGLPGGEWTLSIPSAWKLENGNWYWYVDHSKIVSPVGLATPASSSPGAQAPGGSAAVPGTPPEKIPTSADFVFGKVQADRQTAALEPNATEKINISNSAQGLMQLRLTGAVPGVEGKLDRSDVKAGEKAVLTLRAGDDPKPGILYVVIQPTNEAIAIQVTRK
ncbi:MAG TPA: hypothetical protein VLY04_20715 [Bryobacteraceae bacterium]|nr:hypothetical protein [Bryobacteraceae bacterium]